LTKIAIVTGSVRSGRQSLNIAKWAKSIADERTDAEFEILDIADFNLPVWDEALPPRMAASEKDVTKAWTSKVDEFDGYLFIVSEYNHSITGALKNALDYLSAEFENKAAAFISYGSVGGARAVEHLRGILSEMGAAHVRNQVTMGLASDFENYSVFTPTQYSISTVTPTIDQLVSWSKAMESVRATESDTAIAA
jgi:NAD(P)H-dependent FMN reductase